MKNNQIFVGGAVVFRDYRGKRQYFVARLGEEDKWEFPKVNARRGESSVRASLRMMGEMAGMNTRILEEAGRANAILSVNGRSVPQRLFYYLMTYKAGGEVLGFQDYAWLEYKEAAKKLELKREKDALKGARDALKKWEKEKKI